MNSGTAMVFGGSGFIGRHLLVSLVRHGYRVVSADISPLVPAIQGVHAVHCDVRDSIPKDIVPADLGGHADIVYNIAAICRVPGFPDSAYYETNVSGALTVTEYCRDTGVSRLVFTSTMMVHSAGEERKDESSKPSPETPYGWSKLQAEEIHRNWQKETSGRRLVIVRPAVIFGSGERGNFTRLARALRQRTFVYPGRRDTIKSCGYVDGLIDSIYFVDALGRPSFLFNYCYPTPYTIEEICEAFHAVAQLPRPWGTLPYDAIRMAAMPFELLAKTGLETGIHRERVAKLTRSTYLQPKALLEVGYRFDSDLRSDLARWYASKGGRFN